MGKMYVYIHGIEIFSATVIVDRRTVAMYGRRASATKNLHQNWLRDPQGEFCRVPSMQKV